MAITSTEVTRFIELVAARLKAERQYLTALDSPIGDADHGTNMDRGFSAVVAKLPDLDGKPPGQILKTVGATLVSTVGGAAGPLYGTAFLRAGTALGDRAELAEEDVVRALDAALEGLVARGKARPGEKTMLDALVPALEAFKAARARGADTLAAARAATDAAEAGMKATIPMLATKGRASYLGERSIGHQDPGATSAYYIAAALLATLEGGDMSP